MKRPKDRLRALLRAVPACPEPKDGHAAALAKLMRDISQRGHCAGWLIDHEFWLWRVMRRRSDRRYGFITVTDCEVSLLRSLSSSCGAWVVWDRCGGGVRPAGLRLVALPWWKLCYAAWRASEDLLQTSAKG